MTSGETAPNFSGTDRVTQTTNDVTSDHGTTVRRSRTFVWAQNGVNSSSLASVAEVSADGLNSWQIKYASASAAVTNHTQTSYASPSRTVTNAAPDGSYTVSSYSYGQLFASVQYDSTPAQISGTSYVYDPHERQYQVTDARNGTTTYGYNAADQVNSVTTPLPGNGQSAETTTTLYNSLLRPWIITQPDNTSMTNIYLLTGELGLQSGTRTYPVAYTYDYAGRMQTMTNWSSFSSGGGARVTTWLYDGQRGWLTNKAYADGNGPSYLYTAAGRLHTRAWVRGVTTTYGYDNAGGLSTVSYSDSTPGVTYTNDRLGRQSAASWNGITDTVSYNLASLLLGESFSGGTLAGFAVTNQYDQFLRRTNLAALSSGSQFQAASYGYDHASRLLTVSDGVNTAGYNYLANSPLVGQIGFTNGMVGRMTTTKQYDYLNRLTQISSASGAAYTLPLTFNYNYNPANQRTKDTLADGSYWVYGYDSLGQVTNGCKYFASGSPVPGQQFNYTFDTIGNRTQTRSGGDTNGANLRVANYTGNVLNQVTSRDMPAYVDVMGASIMTNAVTVNGQTAYRNQEYFRQQLPANNSALALWTNIIVSGGLSVTGNVFLAQEPENLRYAADGNLTNDGRWAYTWDAENRLTRMTVNTNVGPQYQLTFAYDATGRRLQKVVNNGGTVGTTNFLYDGWNLIAIFNSQSAVLGSFMWGNDLSGSPQSAGGVGGLLKASYFGTVTTNCFPAFDGNGNVAGLLNAADATFSANYEYGPFGEVIRSTGPMAKVNPIRFSTKYQDDESDLLYYGYRYYKPSTGTWVSRDPINERGFRTITDHKRLPFAREEEKNIYCFNRENPVSIVDPLGLRLHWGWPPWGEPKKKECCKEDDAGTKAAKDLANDSLSNLIDKLQEAAEAGDEIAARNLEVLKRSLFVINAVKSMCDAKNPDGCDDFIKSGDIADCMLCCTSIHALFSNEIGGVGFLISCKYACRNAN
jgi:RHS repeat-associated protein